MKLRNKVSAAGLAGLLVTGLMPGLVTASPGEVEDDLYEHRGPMPFEAYDQNDDGTLSPDEFYDVRAARMKYRAEKGYPMRHAKQAPSFEDIDSDGDGNITREEMQKHQTERMKQRWNERREGRW